MYQKIDTEKKLTDFLYKLGSSTLEEIKPQVIFVPLKLCLAIISAAFAIYHGPEGILKIANRTSKLAKIFADNIKAGGYKFYQIIF